MLESVETDHECATISSLSCWSKWEEPQRDDTHSVDQSRWMDVLFNRRWSGPGSREAERGGREDIKATEVKRAVHHISSCLKGDCFCLLHGNWAGQTVSLSSSWTYLADAMSGCKLCNTVASKLHQNHLLTSFILYRILTGVLVH